LFQSPAIGVAPEFASPKENVRSAPPFAFVFRRKDAPVALA
jgi:hypothetical protein